MRENTYPHVQMSFRCKILNADGRVCKDPENIEEISFGGYRFTIGGKTIPFDWKACSWSFNGENVSVDTGYGPFFNDFRLDDCYDEELAKEGLSRKDLTADFLSGAEKIEEIFCEGGDVLLECIVFHDENANGFRVSNAVINTFNAEVMRNYNELPTVELTLPDGKRIEAPEVVDIAALDMLDEQYSLWHAIEEYLVLFGIRTYDNTPDWATVRMVQDSLLTVLMDAGVNFKLFSDERQEEINKAFEKEEDRRRIKAAFDDACKDIIFTSDAD